MTLSHFFILSCTGDTLLSRSLRGESNKGTPEKFYKVVRERGNELAPVFHQDGVLYFYIRRSGLFFVVTTVFEMPPSYVLEILQRITNALKDFCGSLNEESLRRNFALAYEIIDEMLDFGYQQCMDTSQLKQKVYNFAVASKKQLHVRDRLQGARSIPKTVPSAVSQRPLASPGAQKNEIFVDVLEKMSVVLGSESQYRNAVIEGQIHVKSFLYGSPQIKLALNEDLIINNRRGKPPGVPVLDFCSFHQSVDSSEFEQTRILTFYPTDGEFTAMSYKVLGNIFLPFKISPTIDIQPNKTNFTIIVTSALPGTNSAFFNITCPLPRSTSGVEILLQPNTIPQSAEYKAEENCLTWNVKRIQGSSEVVLRCSMKCTGSKKEFGPINLNFEAPLYSASNVKVRYLRIIQGQGFGTSYRWVRYVTSSNSYVYRF
ncbi:clathrin coat associated protein ap-50, putative [Theileria equi strain WA]|uniref:Clathrin coat associated protein ap-50, putative n=1 Tax=Theileria equi strain WA TaxID=1537102 RepID=L0AVH8_THEEQ|nr:clathrin coat associated protein ap-50, putative [Theileria equi strain WA]AFZ79617.1 clathrin coat associated protein ap-50, putative [Theileria equi strain WA]|eukprot:XP_004829283.1 clathrin coat associated protein ap-50, putative [Theileria equi strain WA]